MVFACEQAHGIVSTYPCSLGGQCGHSYKLHAHHTTRTQTNLVTHIGFDTQRFKGMVGSVATLVGANSGTRVGVGWRSIGGEEEIGACGTVVAIVLAPATTTAVAAIPVVVSIQVIGAAIVGHAIRNAWGRGPLSWCRWPCTRRLCGRGKARCVVIRIRHFVARGVRFKSHSASSDAAVYTTCTASFGSSFVSLSIHNALVHGVACGVTADTRRAYSSRHSRVCTLPNVCFPLHTRSLFPTCALGRSASLVLVLVLVLSACWLSIGVFWRSWESHLRIVSCVFDLCSVVCLYYTMIATRHVSGPFHEPSRHRWQSPYDQDQDTPQHQHQRQHQHHRARPVGGGHHEDRDGDTDMRPVRDYHNHNHDNKNTADQQFDTQLRQLTSASRSRITALATLAHEARHSYGARIVALLTKRIDTDRVDDRMPALYVMDAMVKHAQHAAYIDGFARHVERWVLDADQRGSRDTRHAVDALVLSWDATQLWTRELARYPRAVANANNTTKTNANTSPGGSKRSRNDDRGDPSSTSPSPTKRPRVDNDRSPSNEPDRRTSSSTWQSRHGPSARSPSPPPPRVQLLPRIHILPQAWRGPTPIPTSTPQPVMWTNGYSGAAQPFIMAPPLQPPSSAPMAMSDDLVEQTLMQLASALGLASDGKTTPAVLTPAALTPTPTTGDGSFLTPLQKLESSEWLKTRNESAIAALYENVHLSHADARVGTPKTLSCHTCGLRQPHSEAMAKHLDWHFRVNRGAASAGRRVAGHAQSSRGFFATTNEWATSSDSDNASVAGSASAPPWDSGVGTGDDKDAKRTPGIPLDESQPECPVCRERFQSTWDDAQESWVVMDVVMVPRTMGMEDDTTTTEATPETPKSMVHCLCIERPTGALTVAPAGAPAPQAAPRPASPMPTPPQTASVVGVDAVHQPKPKKEDDTDTDVDMMPKLEAQPSTLALVLSSGLV